MKRLFCFVFTALMALPAVSETAAPDLPPPIFLDGENVDLNEFLWIKRPIAVFADSPADPRFIQQMELLHERAEELAERDVVVLTDTNPEGRSKLRQKLRPRGFMLALVIKDGTVYLRKPVPWDVREISRVIDKLPMRQQEIRERREQRN